MMKKLVNVESPFGKRVDGTPCTPQEMAENKAYLNACLRDCVRLGEQPYASHAYMPLVLNDAKAEERLRGMGVGFAWAEALAIACQYEARALRPRRITGLVAVYVDRGITPGMAEGVERHRAWGLEIVERRLGGGWAK